jgi:hypothetical protein
MVFSFGVGCRISGSGTALSTAPDMHEHNVGVPGARFPWLPSIVVMYLLRTDLVASGLVS